MWQNGCVLLQLCAIIYKVCVSLSPLNFPPRSEWPMATMPHNLLQKLCVILRVRDLFLYAARNSTQKVYDLIVESKCRYVSGELIKKINNSKFPTKHLYFIYECVCLLDVIGLSTALYIKHIFLNTVLSFVSLLQFSVQLFQERATPAFGLLS